MRVSGLLLGMLFANAALASQQPFSTWTDEATTKGWHIPGAGTAQRIFQSLDAGTAERLRDYFRQHGKIRPKGRVLAVRNLKICADCSGKHFVVRSSSALYSPLAGPHTFSYWIIDDRDTILLQGGADKIDVVDTGKSYSSIIESNCLTSACYETRYEFSDKGYVRAACRKVDLDGNVTGGCDRD